ASNTQYFWQIVARNANGSTTGPIWKFTTSGAPPGGLPPTWSEQDVGSVAAAGSASFANGIFTVQGAGDDVWGVADGFNFVNRTVPGDVTDVPVVAPVASLQNTSTFAKAGIMMRTSTAADAVHVILDLRPTGDVEFMTRPSAGAATTWLTGAGQPAPA